MNTRSLANLAIMARRDQESDFRKRSMRDLLVSIAKDSGISYVTLLSWKDGKTEANFSNMRAVLNSCGLDFEIKEINK